MKAVVAMVAFCMTIVGAFAQSDVEITAFHGNGVVTWEGALLNSTCQVQWAASLTDSGRTNWHSLTNTVVGYPHMNADVPMFFRIVALPETNSLMTGLVAWYPFSTNANDASGYGNNGTMHGAMLTNDVERGNSCYFDGVDDFVEVPDSDSLSLVSDMTIAVWIKATDYTFERGIVGKTIGGAIPSPYDFYLGTTEGAVVPGTPLLYTHVNWRANGTNAPVQGQWAHLAVVVQGSNVTHYLNGQLNGSATGAIRASDGNGPLRIGSRDNLGTRMYGCLDDVRIYNRALSSNEVSTLSGLLQ